MSNETIIDAKAARRPAVIPGAPPREPKYQRGASVVAMIDLYNDGSYPNRANGALLVTLGALGEVVQVGLHVETGTPIYMVQFGGRDVVGCLEEEIVFG
ncbi:MAG: nitrogen fixation protein NifZ [Pseudomonadota bacterium]